MTPIPIRIEARQSLRAHMIVLVALLAAVPLLFVMGLTGQYHFRTEQEQSLDLQRQIAVRLGREVRTTVQDSERALSLALDLTGFGQQVEVSKQHSVLQLILLRDQIVQNVTFLDRLGQEKIRLSRTEVIPDRLLTDRSMDDVYRVPATQRRSFVGPLYTDEKSREPLLTIALPLINQPSGGIDGVIVVDIRFKQIWTLVSELDLPLGSDAYVIDTAGTVIAHRNPSVVLRQTTTPAYDQDGRTTGLDGSEVIRGRYSFMLGQQRITAISEQSLDRALAPLRTEIQILAAKLAAASLAALGLILLIIKQMVEPIENLAGVVQEIVRGDLSRRAETNKRDEIGVLGHAFNQLLEQTIRSINTLEANVLERTQALAALVDERDALIGELQVKNRELERFTYTVSHDLKSPLVTITGFLGLLESDIKKNNPQRIQSDIVRMREAAVTMQRLLDELLELPRIGQVANIEGSVDLNMLIASTLNLMASVIAEKHVSVHVEPGLPTIVGDWTRLHEVFQNLIENAIKFMGDQAHPRIEIGAVERADHIACFVKDNGSGIDPAYHERIFHIFDRLDTSVEGTGIGLALAKQIVEVHGGTL